MKQKKCCDNCRESSIMIDKNGNRYDWYCDIQDQIQVTKDFCCKKYKKEVLK